MAIYHLSTKAISRSKGQSVVASAAYRAGEKLKDERTGLLADYSRKSEIDHTEIFGFEGSRETLWNMAEQAERRKDATLAKEYEIALPVELNRTQKIQLARSFAVSLQQRHQVAVDLCIHKIDSNNPHAHILTTTREVLNGKELGGKVAREWSDTKRKKHGLPGRKEDLLEARVEWGMFANMALERAGCEAQIDHRSLKDQGLGTVPTIHIGVNASAMERKGIHTERGNQNREIQERNVEIQTQQKEQAQLKQEMSSPELNDEAVIEAWKAQSKVYYERAQNRRKEDLELTQDAIQRSHWAIEYHEEHLKPERPTGLLAAFKQKRYEEDWEKWDKGRQELSEKHRKLSRQALGHEESLSRVALERTTKEQMAEHHPELHQRYEVITKKRLELEAQRRTEERLMRRERSRLRGRDRGFGH